MSCYARRMSEVIPQRDLRNRNAQVIAAVVEGQSFVVTRDGTPVADLVPHVASPRPPRFPRVADLGDFLRPGGLDGEAWLADVRSLDDEGPQDPWERRG